MRPLCARSIAILAAASAPFVAGCGGGSGPSVTAPVRTSQGRTVSYSVVDLGATPYDYSFYWYSATLYRVQPPLDINNASWVVSGAGNRAAVWQASGVTYLAGQGSTANGVNNNGEAVGEALYATQGFNSQLATAWQNGQGTNLGTLTGGYWSLAMGVNNGGQVVGIATGGTGPYCQGFLWQNGSMQGLGVLGGDYSVAAAINNGGSVVGWSTLAAQGGGYSYNTHAFLWQNGSMTDLGTLPGGASSDASAINDAGTIVGSSDSAPADLYADQIFHPVLWQGGKIQDLGTLGGPSGVGYGINTAGQIVGVANTGTVNTQQPPTYPVWWGVVNPGGVVAAAGGSGGAATGSTSTSTGTTPPAPTVDPILVGAGASSIQNRGAKRSGAKTRGIGDAYIAHAFVWTNGQMSDLNNLVPANSGWVLNVATGINDAGAVVGYGSLNGRTHAFLLSPQ